MTKQNSISEMLLLLTSLSVLLILLAPRHASAISQPYLVKNINSYGDAIESTAVKPLTVLGNNLIFSANEGATGQELWKSNGTDAGTQLIVNIRPGISWSSPENLTTVNGKVIFTANDGVTGKELWATDGTGSGTQQLADIYLGATSSTPQKFTLIGNTLYFVAATASGSKLWKTDGTPAGTMLADEFTPGFFSSIDSLTAVGGKLLVVTFLSGVTATWNILSVDPGAGTTEGIKTFLSLPKHLTPCNGRTFFSVNEGGYGYELWQTDGTASGTLLVKDINSGNSSNPSLLTCIGTTLFFTASDPASGTELWKSDGTSDGTVMVKDIYSGTTGSSINYLTELNGKLVFQANSPETGAELWQSDGTEAGTTLLADINPGTGWSSPVPRFVASDTLFVSTNSGLWLTDGTTEGTRQLSSITSANNFVRIGNIVYFSAIGSGVGNELWAVSLGLEPFTRIISPQADSATNMGTITISGEAQAQGEAAVVLTEVSMDGGTTWVAADGTTGWNYSWSPAADGTYTIMARSSDSSSVTQTIPAAVNVTIDRAPPAASLQINNNDQSTPYRTVTLSLTASATETGLDCSGLTICGNPQARFSNDGTTWSPWGAAIASRQWDLDTVNGVKTVYVQVKDRAGNTTDISDTIMLDTSQVPSSTITSPATGFATNGSSVTVRGTAAPGSGGGTVTLVEVSANGGSTWQTATGTTTWSITLSLPSEGSYTIKSRAWNNALVEPVTSSVTVTVDRTPPTGELALFYGVWTLNANATIPGSVCILIYPFICGSLEISSNGTTWQPATTTPGTGGPFWLRDSAGNTSFISGRYDNSYGGPFQVSGATSAYYSLIQHAYDAASNNDLLKLTAGSTENLTLSRSINLTIRGGYASGFSSVTGTTPITGGLTVQSGSATIENIDLSGTMTVIGGDATLSSVSVN